MKKATIAICCLMLVAAARSETVPDYRPVSQNIELVVTRKGTPAAAIPVSFTLDRYPEEAPFWTGSTDKNGKLVPPKLVPGNYRIFANGGKRDSTLYIDVADAHTGRAKLEMKLTVPGIGDAEDAPVSARITDFEGVVLDPSGAALANSPIEVLRRDDVDAGPALKIQSDSSGQFAAHLNNGIYIAVIYREGFKRSVAVFEVAEQGKDRLKVVLQVGGVA